MLFFKEKESVVWEKSSTLIADTIDAVMGKTVELYTGDDALVERVSEAKVLDISLECAFLLMHILDLMLYKKRKDIRTSIMLSMYQTISTAYNVREIDEESDLQIQNIIDDRMERYGMITRGVWYPAGFWWFGTEMKKEALIQCYALFGDYITYFREYDAIPIGDDIEPVILVDPLDCESLAVPFIVFQILSKALEKYIEKLQKIIR